MTKSEIYDLLTEVFHEFNVHTLDRDPFHSISIHPHLQVFTYNTVGVLANEEISRETIWYFKDSGITLGKEIPIPNENSKEFLEVYFMLFKQSIEAHKVLEEIRKSLEPENLQKLIKSQIRNKKLEALIPLNN